MEVNQLINDEARYGSGTVVIRMPVSEFQGFFLPNREGSITIKAVFKKMTVQDSMIIDKLSFQNKTFNGIDVSGMDYLTYRNLIVRRCLISIDDVEVKRNNEWMVEEDWNKIKKMNAMVLNSLISEFEYLTVIAEEENALIGKQASTLFGQDNGKVLNPHPAIAMYCTLSSIWDKFGLDIDSMKNMFYDDYLKIKAVMNRESEIMKKGLHKQK